VIAYEGDELAYRSGSSQKYGEVARDLRGTFLRMIVGSKETGGDGLRYYVNSFRGGNSHLPCQQRRVFCQRFLIDTMPNR